MGMLLRRHRKEELIELSEMTIKQLKAMAKEKGIDGYSALDKEALIEALKE